MSQDNFFSNFFSQSPFFKTFEDMRSSAFDVSALLEAQRKNFQTFTEAQQIALQSAQSIAYRQAELFSQIMKEQSTITSSLLKEGKPEDKIAKNAELFKSSYEKTMEGINEISDLVRKSNTETSSVLNKRISASLKEIRGALEKSQGGAKKAA